MVPMSRAEGMSHRLQALFTSRCNINGVQCGRLRDEFCGRLFCFASRETMRGAVTAMSKEPGRKVRTDKRGAHLMDLHSAICSVDTELWSTGKCVDGFVRDAAAAIFPHTTAFVPTLPGQPYILHSD